MDLNPNTSNEKIRKIIKILYVGDQGTGKTSLIRQYCNGCFSEFYKPTIGADFASKDIEYSPNLTINLCLWDIYGQERYTKMSRVYFQNAHAAVITFDILRPPTFNAVMTWKKEIDESVFTVDKKPIPCMLIGNKIDLSNDGKWFKTKEEIDEFGFFETSAKETTNVDNSMMTLVKYIIENNIEPYKENVQQPVQTEDQQKKSCCNIF